MTMRTRKARKGDKVYLFRVTLDQQSPILFEGRVNRGIQRVCRAPWRVIAMLGTHTLYQFAEAITAAFGFWFDHAFGFYDNVESMYDSRKRYELFVDIGEEYEPGTEGVERTTVARAFPVPPKTMLFYFDYGDGWRFLVELEKIIPPDPDGRYPIVVSAAGRNPEQYPAVRE